MPLAAISLDRLEGAYERADAWLRQGDLAAAKREFARLLEGDFRVDHVSERLAYIAEKQGEVAEGIRWLARGIEKSPGSGSLHYAQGRLLKRSGDKAGAERHYREALDKSPDLVAAWISLGILLREENRLEEAENSQREALRRDPGNFSALLSLGNILLALDRADEALDVLQQAVEKFPLSAEAHNSLGRAMTGVGKLVATPHFTEALRLRPDYWEAAEGLGKYLMRSGEYRDAARAFERACELRPDMIKLRINRADAWLAAGEFSKAEAEYEQLLPRARAAAVGGLAASLTFRGDYETASRLFEESLAEEPESPRVKQHYALFLLKHGRFGEGWPLYEARERRKSVEAYRSFAAGRDLTRLEDCKWSGQPLADKTILVTCEQGLGDEIMFASILSDLIERAGHVVLECDQRLATLFSRSFPDCTIVGIDRFRSGWRQSVGAEIAAVSPFSSIPAFDYWISSGSLGAAFRKGADEFPRHDGYLRPNPDLRRKWNERLRQSGSGLKIGISWRGGTLRTRHAERSLSLEQLLPVLSMGQARRDIQFVSLQYEKWSAEIEPFTAAYGIRLHHWQESIDDYDETAALVSELDLTITVCTSIVHLCGALGRPVWVMAPRVAEWRYGAQGRSMIWYPVARMYRQSQAGDWTGVVSEVTDDLAALLERGGRHA